MIDSRIGYMICETASTNEDTKAKPNIITQQNNRVIVETVLQDMNVKNRNGRFYASEDMLPEITCPRTKELVSTGNMKGECGHPLAKDIARQQTIDPKNVQVKYLKIWADGNNIMAHTVGTQNQLGEEFNNDILAGELPSFSLRALGTIHNSSKGAEVKNLKIITWDRVIYPSHKAAYTKGIVSESAYVSIGKDQDTKCILSENDKGLLVPINNKQVTDYIKEQSLNFKAIKESFDLLYDDITLLENGSQVQLSSKTGDVLVVNLENYISNEIMKYCYDKL